MFSRKLAGVGGESNIFIKSSLLKQSVIVWCQVFGSKGEDLHWSNVVSKQSFVAPFDMQIILDATGFSSKEWSAYHETLKHLRDRFFAHFDMDEFSQNMPSMDKALVITEVYRDWLYGMLLEAMKTNPISIGFERTEEFNKRVESEWKP